MRPVLPQSRPRLLESGPQLTLAIRVLWGCSMLGMGFVTNFSGLMAARWFLGLTVAGLFPGVNYYLSCWYVSFFFFSIP